MARAAGGWPAHSAFQLSPLLCTGRTRRLRSAYAAARRNRANKTLGWCSPELLWARPGSHVVSCHSEGGFDRELGLLSTILGLGRTSGPLGMARVGLDHVGFGSTRLALYSTKFQGQVRPAWGRLGQGFSKLDPSREMIPGMDGMLA